MRRRLWEAGKSVLLIGLIVSALILTLVGWIYDERLLDEGEPLHFLQPAARFMGMLPEQAAPLPLKPEDSLVCIPAASPYCLAVRDENGVLRGALYDPAVDAGLARSTGQLSEAMGTAGPAKEITRAAWEQALRAPCLFWEYPTPLPLSAVAAWMSFSSWDFDGTVLRMALSAQSEDSEGYLTLYYTNGDATRYYARSTHLPADAMALDGVALTVCRFVFEDDGAWAGLHPDMLLPERFTALPRLRGVPVETHGLTTELLDAFDFNPNTNAQYTEADGTAVYVDNRRTLRLGPDGRVLYRDVSPLGSQNALTIPSSMRLSEQAAAAELCRGLLPDTSLLAEQAELCLQSLEGQDGTYTLTFGYVFRGAVLLAQDSGARFTLQNGVLTEAALTLRHFQEDAPGETPLPLRQVVALLPAKQSFLRFCYTEEPGGLYSADWYAS